MDSTDSAYAIGDRVVLTDDAATNETYQTQGLSGRILIVTNRSFNQDQHPGYDPGLGGEALYDLAFADTSEPVPCSLYEYELTAP